VKDTIDVAKTSYEAGGVAALIGAIAAPVIVYLAIGNLWVPDHTPANCSVAFLVRNSGIRWTCRGVDDFATALRQPLFELPILAILGLMLLGGFVGYLVKSAWDDSRRTTAGNV
jgi:hypothetical protein